LQKQIEWTSFGTTINPFSRYVLMSFESPKKPLIQAERFSIPAIVRWYNNRQINHYANAEIDKRIAEYLKGSTSGIKQNRSKSIITLALEQYMKEEQVQGQASRRKAFKQIVAPQLRVFLFAGRDTTSSTLLYCYHILATHPDIVTNLRKEHDEVFGTEISCAHETITQNPQRLNQLPYTSAVIKEVLRLFPPSASMRQGRPGASIADEDGLVYPTEGCNVWVLTLGLHHNPNYWKQAESFIPERWLVEPEHPLYPVKGAWRAFEFGPRGCIGQTLALLELRIALVMTVREFEIRPAYEEWGEINMKNMREGSINMVDGSRAYQAKKGGGGAHPADGYPCRVNFRK
jgi:cytochrome P450